MNVFPNGIPAPTGPDEDLEKQARPGHGVPSQDPDPAAQVPLTHEESEREVRSTYIGGTVMVGAATGAAVGVAVAGPVGAVVGGTIGAVAGAAGGAVVGTAIGAAVTAEASPGKPVDSATLVDRDNATDTPTDMPTDTPTRDGITLDPAQPRPGDTRSD